MAEEIAQLGIAVDARPVDAAAVSLDKMAAASNTAAASVGRLQTASGAAGQSLKGLAAQASLDKVNAQLNETNLILRSIASAAGQTGSAFSGMGNAVRTSAAGHSAHAQAVGLNRIQMMELTHVARSMFDMMAAGQSPLRALQVEGMRIAQIFTEGSGGVGGTLRAIGGVLGGLVAPAAAAAVGIAAVALTGVYSFIKWENQIDKLGASLDGIGRRTGITVEGLNRIAATAARSGGISQFAGQDLAAGFAGTGNIGVPLIGGLIQQTKTFARVTGQDLETAGSELAKAFSDPSKGADELNSKLGFLDDRTRELIRTMQASGNIVGAQGILLNAMSSTISTTTDRTWSLAKAWHGVGDGIDFVIAKTGQLAHSFTDSLDPSQQEAIAKTRQRVLAGRAAQGYDVGDQTVKNDSDIRDAAIMQTEASRRAASRARTANAAAASITAGDIARSIQPDIDSIKKLQEQYAALNTALNTPGALDVLGITAKQAADALEAAGNAQRTWTDTLKKTGEVEANTIAGIRARTVAEREAVAIETERIALEGKAVTALEARARSEAAAAEIEAKSTRSALDRLDTANDAASLAGLQSYQRSRQEILNRLRRQQIDDTGNPAAQASNRAAADAELAALQKTSVQGPIDQANRSVAAQIAMLKVQVATFGQSTSAIAAAAKEQELINGYVEAGIPLNDALRSSVHETALTYGTYADAAEKAALAQKKSIDAMDGLRSATSSALNTIADDIVNGKTKNIGRDLAKQIGAELIKSGISQITTGLLGQQGKAGGGLFGDFFGKLLGVGGKPDGTPGNPVFVAMGGVGAAAGLLGGGTGSGSTGGTLSDLIKDPIGFWTKQRTPAANDNTGMGIGALGAVTSAALPNIYSPYMNGGGPGNSFNMAAAAQAIKNIESSGGNYGALGNVLPSGDRAYGAYQVMGNNIAPWSQRYLGRTMTPSQFIGDPAAQDQIFQGEFGRLEGRYGLTGAAQAWFGGPGAVGQTGRRDINGTSVGGYGQQFASFYAQNGGQNGGMQAPALQQLAPQIQAINTAATRASAGVSQLTSSAQGVVPATQSASSGLSSLVNSLGSIGGMIGGRIGGRFGGQIGSGIGSIFSSVLHIFGFSEGGVMTSAGPRQLQRFANGGTSNQAAIFGEAGPEAAVPLPDGRSIPVSIRAPTAPQRSAPSGNVFHVGGPTITIQGDASDKTISLIRDEVERSRGKTMSELQRTFPAVSQTAARLYG